MAADSPTPPSFLIGMGIILTVPGMLILLLGGDDAVAGVVGPLLLFLGGISGMVGVIGAGVMVGVRRAEWLRDRR